jgi:dihydropteroate synthase
MRLALPRARFLELEPFAIMAILNVTPDSFYAPSRKASVEAARDAALAALKNGADLIDLGGESTRPGSEYVSLDEELARVLPAVEAIRAESDAPISVDTRKAEVARACLAAGADIVNDVSALGDPAMAEVIAESGGAALVLMHMKGEPATMQKEAAYGDCPREVTAFLRGAAAKAEAAGVSRDRIVLDPGVGFGKRLEDNLALIAQLPLLGKLGYPLLVGLSRKSFVGALTGRPVEGRLAGSLGAACAAYAGGARIFRVHDPAETRDALALFAASLAGGAAARDAARSGSPRDIAKPVHSVKGGSPWASA